MGSNRCFVTLSPDDFLANGIALTADGSVLVANLAPSGGLWRVLPSGRMEPCLFEVDGAPLRTVNFVSVDREERIWLAISTRQIPREGGLRRSNADGYVVLWDRRGARIVADGLSFTNEALVDPTGRYLYVNETVGRRVIRYPLSDDGLGDRQVVAQFGGDGIFPDGLGFDAEGGVWVVSVVSNRVIRIDAEGRRTVVLEDAAPGAVALAEAAFAADTFNRDAIDGGRHGRLGNTSSLAFGGSDRKTVYLGSIYNDCLAVFRSPVAGAEPVHWRF